MYAVHLRLTGKLVGDFLLVIIELFSLGEHFRLVTIHAFDSQTGGRTDAHRNTSLAYLQRLSLIHI